MSDFRGVCSLSSLHQNQHISSQLLDHHPIQATSVRSSLMMAPMTETKDPLSIVYDVAPQPVSFQPVYPSQATAEAPEVVTEHNRGSSVAPQYAYNQDPSFRFPPPEDPLEISKPLFQRWKTILVVLIALAAVIAIVVGVTVSQTKKSSAKDGLVRCGA